jgi:hypothetical protein
MIRKALAKITSSVYYRNTFFITLSILVVLPFIVTHKFPLIADGWFHIPRIHELAESIRHGKFFPDVAYFDFNQQGYGVNFFYPYVLNYPVALLYLLTSDFVLSFLIVNVLIHVAGLNIAYWTYNKLTNRSNYAIFFALLYIFGDYYFNSELLSLKTYNQHVAYIFLPLVLISIPQVIAGNFREWRWPCTLGIVLITLTHLLTVYLLVFYTGFILIYGLVLKRQRLSLDRLKCWLLSLTQIILSTAIFIIPLLEQKLANTWLEVPALNLSFKGGIIASNARSFDFWTNHFVNALMMQDAIMLIFVLILVLCVAFRCFTHLSKWFLLATLLTGIIQSDVVPYQFLQQYPLIDMIQFVSRFDCFLYFFMAMFVAVSLDNLNTMRSSDNRHSFYILEMLSATVVSLQTVFIVIVMLLGTSKVPTGTASPENIAAGLSHPNYGYKTADSIAGHYHINGHMDYRPVIQMDEIRSSTGTYKIQNSESYAPIINFEPAYQVETNDIVENAVYFDNQKILGRYSAQDFNFIVSDIPTKTKVVRTSIAYLKGFLAHDANGSKLPVRTAYNGTLEIANNGTNRIIISYKKTTIHLVAICISITTWLTLGYKAYSKKFE